MSSQMQASSTSITWCHWKKYMNQVVTPGMLRGEGPMQTIWVIQTHWLQWIMDSTGRKELRIQLNGCLPTRLIKKSMQELRCLWNWGGDWRQTLRIFGNWDWFLRTSIRCRLSGRNAHPSSTLLLQGFLCTKWTARQNAIVPRWGLVRKQRPTWSSARSRAWTEMGMECPVRVFATNQDVESLTSAKSLMRL